jgi:hypothetical protein
MSVGRLLIVGFALVVVGCSLIIPFDDYDSQYGAKATDASRAPDGAARTCTADLKTDRQNCGACFHDCQGATCQDSKCGIDTLASDSSPVFKFLVFEGLAQDDVWIYGAANQPNDHGIGRMKKADKTVAQAILHTTSPVHLVAVRGQDLYWAEDDGVGTIRKPDDNSDPSPGPNVTIFTPHEPNPPDSLAVDDTFVYWTSVASHVIRRAARSTKAVETIVSGPTRSPRKIASDGTFIYWTDGTNAQVMRSQPDGTGATAIVASQPSAAGLWVDGSDVYFTTETVPGAVMRCKKDGSGLVAIASAEPTPPGRVVVKDDFVYWIDQSNGALPTLAPTGSLRRARIDGSEPPLTLADRDAPVDLVVDDTYLYWSSAASHGINRVAR